ncbi:MAG: hypothetical protein BWY78_00856 [Alphaproteobacteria bacterium ADurb.Bin438]|nr:MAG: hypothetical protein BWY78_00856 [Alphaproteobacteria bacterium ADurb.Bin438]
MKKKFVIAIFFMIIIAILLVFHFYVNKKEKEETQPIPDLIVKSIISNQKENGLFNYEYDFEKKSFTSTDNIIHQAEISLVLLDYLEKNPNDEMVKNSLKSLLKGLSDLIKSGKYGVQISYFDKVDEENLSYDEKVLLQKQLRAEISATSLMIASMTRFRRLYNELDFATTESYVIETLVNVAKTLLKQEDILNALYKYPPYELWYALSVFNENNSNKEINSLLNNLDKFFTSIENIIDNKESLLYFIKTSLIRYKSNHSPYIAGALLRNIRYFFNNYDNDYNSSILNCTDSLILMNSYESLKELDADKHKFDLINLKIKNSKKEDEKFFIKQGQEWIVLDDGKIFNSSEIKKFTGFFTSGYGNPITTIKNSSACYEIFSKNQTETKNLKN